MVQWLVGGFFFGAGLKPQRRTVDRGIMDTIIAEHMRLAAEIVEQDAELGAMVMGDELDRLMAESLEHWMEDAGPWCTIPHALLKDIGMALGRIRRDRGAGRDE